MFDHPPQNYKQGLTSPTATLARDMGTDAHKLQLMKASFFIEDDNKSGMINFVNWPSDFGNDFDLFSLKKPPSMVCKGTLIAICQLQVAFLVVTFMICTIPRSHCGKMAQVWVAICRRPQARPILAMFWPHHQPQLHRPAL